MKKIYFILLVSFASYGQIQIGLDIDGETIDDLSGNNIALSSDGKVVAIGAYYNGGNGKYSGHVRVYSNNTGTWTQIGSDINGEAAGDFSGGKVALSADGTIIAIGASANSNENGNLSGHVRVYKNILDTWTQIGSDINGEATGDRSGASVSLSSDGTIIAIGADYNDGNGVDSGHVRVFKNISDEWIQIGTDINGESAGDQSGSNVSLSSDGNLVAISAQNNAGNGTDSGHVRIYKNISDTWTQIGNDINGEAENDLFGSSISLSSDGSIIAIGAIQNDGNGDDSGHVRVFKNISNSWIQVGTDIDGEAENDLSGYSVSLSSDGNIIAIGATDNAGNGSYSGHVRIYKNIDGNWTQIGKDIDGEAIDDSSGTGVSLSSNGNIVAIGAYFNDGNGNNSGHVRVYDLSAVLNNKRIEISSFSLFPNPVSSILNIELQNNLDLQKVNFYNSHGQLVKSSIQNQINISDLSNGCYFVEVVTNYGNVTKTIIIK